MRQVSRKPGCVSSSVPGTTCLVYNLHRKYPAWQIPCRQCPKNLFEAGCFSFQKLQIFFEIWEGTLLAFEVWRTSNASLSTTSLSLWCLYLLGARRLWGALEDLLFLCPPCQHKPGLADRADICFSADAVDGRSPVMVAICIHLLMCIQHKLEENETFRIQ